MSVIATILDLPVIVQGALGSGLFWLVLELGQRAVKKMSDFQRQSNKHNRSAARIAMGSLLEKNPEQNRILFQLVIQGALHNLVSALIFLAIGLIIDSTIPVFGAVGFIGCLYYLFRALAFLPDFSRWKNEEEMQKKYRAE